jgi:hypothetical protein
MYVNFLVKLTFSTCSLISGISGTLYIVMFKVEILAFIPILYI